jgi:pyruvate kinase
VCVCVCVCNRITDVPLTERKGVNLPGVTVDLPNVTKKDEVDMQTARELGVDFIFASFVQSGAMVHTQLRCTGEPFVSVREAKKEREKYVCGIEVGVEKS